MAIFRKKITHQSRQYHSCWCGKMADVVICFDEEVVWLCDLHAIDTIDAVPGSYITMDKMLSRDNGNCQ